MSYTIPISDLSLDSSGNLIVPGAITAASITSTSTTKAFVPPVMTTTQKNAIVSPVTGSLVYDSTLGSLQEYNGTSWVAVSGGSGTVNSGTAGQLAYYATSTNAVSGSSFLTTDNTNNLTIGVGGAGSNDVTTTINCGALPSIGRINFCQNGVIDDFVASVGTNGLNISSGAGRSTILTINGSIQFSLDGTTNTSTKPIAMSANKITGLANGTASTDATAFGQIYYGFQAASQTTTTTTSSTTGTTFVTSALTQTFTPTSSSHRVKVTITCGVLCGDTTGACYITIARNGTNLAGSQGFAIFSIATGASLQTPACIQFIDSPATTSATTYALYFRTDTSGHSVSVVPSSTTGVMIIEEIV